MTDSKELSRKTAIFASRSNRPVYAAITTGLIYSVFVLFRLQQFDFNPSAFVVAGDRGVQRQSLPESFVVLVNSDGYDGQYFYGLAVSPFRPDPIATGITGISAYRHQRIFYPFIVWLLSFGKKDYVPPLLIAVNLAGLCLVSLLSGMFFKHINRHALWGIIVSLYPGYVLTLSRDLAEIVTASLMLAGIICFVKARFTTGSIFLSLGVLTRETALITAFGALMSAPSPRKERSTGPGAFLTFLIPGGVYLLCQIALWLYWGSAPLRTAGGLMGIPMAGFVDRLFAALDGLRPVDMSVLLDFTFICAFVLINLFFLRGAECPVIVKRCFIISAVMVSLLGDQIWAENFGYYRATSELFLFGYLILFSSSRAARVTLAIYSVILWIGSAIRQILYP